MMKNAASALWVYCPASPDSGYYSAALGYASKLAARLGFALDILDTDDADLLCARAESHGVPAMIIGVGQVVNWPAHTVPPLCLKSRPYADQHGAGPSMHGLTSQRMQAARQFADAIWADMALPAALMLLGNPYWLVGQEDEWAGTLLDWLVESGAKTLMLSLSPRTNPLVWPLFSEAIDRHAAGRMAVVHNGECGADMLGNSYWSMLAKADTVLVLGCSRSMVGEALMSHAPVYIRADRPDADAAFAAAIAQDAMMAARCHLLDTSRSIEWTRHMPYDCTEPYLEQALAEWVAWQKQCNRQVHSG